MSFEFLVDGYNHGKREAGIDLYLHAIEISGAVLVGAIAKLELEDDEYTFKVMELQKKWKRVDSLSAEDELGGVGVQFISPEKCLYVKSPSVWVEIFSGERIKCVSISN